MGYHCLIYFGKMASLVLVKYYLFSDINTKKSKSKLLKNYPCFTTHAIFVPFLYTTSAEIGSSMIINWLQESFSKH